MSVDQSAMKRCAQPKSWMTRVRASAFAITIATTTMVGGLVTAQPAHAADTKFAVIDLRRAIFETEDGLRAQANLKKLLDKRTADFDAKQRDFMRDKEQFDKDQQAGKLSKDKLQKVAEDLQRRFNELQGMQVDYQREMQRQEGEMMVPIQQRLMGIVRRIAAQDGYEMVLEKSAVPYFRADLEITDRAIQMYNTGGESAPGTGKPAPATTTPAPAKPGAAPAAPAAPKPAPKK